MKCIEIEQIGSPVRRHWRQPNTLIGLKLNKIGRTAWCPDTPATRGMIDKVRHLVRVVHDPAATNQDPPLLAPDEAADVRLMRELVFDGNGVVLEPYDAAALNSGKTPDFKLLKDGRLSGYCELKSPRDPNAAPPPKTGHWTVRKNLPFYRKLGNQIRGAALQFGAENPMHDKPNILVFVSHTPEIQRRDLIATISGLPIPGSPDPLFMLGRKMQAQVNNAARAIDLFLWIDADTGKCEYLTPADAKHGEAALTLLGLPS
jgi:large subunit ribosomal protein L30